MVLGGFDLPSRGDPVAAASGLVVPSDPRARRRARGARLPRECAQVTHSIARYTNAQVASPQVTLERNSGDNYAHLLPRFRYVRI
jgi:hypothetical protein